MSEKVWSAMGTAATVGKFVTLHGERFYQIQNVDRMPPFLISLVSDNDLWMFVASNGGLTAGRVSADTALFPYITVDKIYDSVGDTGPSTIVRLRSGQQLRTWEPFVREHDGRYKVSRNLYKNVLGDKLLFEEINHDLQLAYSYDWSTSNRYGFVRTARLRNMASGPVDVDVIDGMRNLLPAGTPRFTQGNASYLVDAYKRNELFPDTGMAVYTLFSGISDRPEPCESLRATTVFHLGLDQPKILLSDRQLAAFRCGEDVVAETDSRGIRGAYYVNVRMRLAPQQTLQWQQVADLEKTQTEVVDLAHRLSDPGKVALEIEQGVQQGSDSLARIIAGSDGFQSTGEENVAVHHYANVLFNVLRGGTAADQYQVHRADFSRHLRLFNKTIEQKYSQFIASLPEQLSLDSLMQKLAEQDDPQLLRLGLEFLPFTFGRRHGDPSRPWNQFSIRLKDDRGNRMLSYEGNWRDIFQNWEALLLSYPRFIDSIIAKFVNASTVDGYNPYRITNEGIDWEVEEPDDPWSYIGYWGDHQIIYLQKLLELSAQFQPGRLGELLRLPLFSYANVPYRLKSFDAVLENAKDTVKYDHALADKIEKRVNARGADGKLVLDDRGQVYQVNLLEKLLVALLCKLSNLVVDGGIWLNSQRPEWNDANNALVGQGLSMVTLYYMRRYVAFMQQLLANSPGNFSLSNEVAQWLEQTADILSETRRLVEQEGIDDRKRLEVLVKLGESASRYREQLYAEESYSGTTNQDLALVDILLEDAISIIDSSIASNRRADGLYHAYNTLQLEPQSARIDSLYLMLEGQVAALSSGAVTAAEAVQLLDAMHDSALYRADQDSFLLYPDRKLPGFLEKNRIPGNRVDELSSIKTMLGNNDQRLIGKDANGVYRFNADLKNAGDLQARIEVLVADYGEALKADRDALLSLYEEVFDHNSFTGRSGGMFGFEGLGSIYWHMVSKLLLAVAEVFFAARSNNTDIATLQRLGQHYYRIRAGIGFNKTPGEYGAFPTDPYSHTPGHAGAQQPGMTGQVKEEILARFLELGVRVTAGEVLFDPALLRRQEFVTCEQEFRYLDIADQWHTLSLPASSLGFTWCQVPVVYRLDENAAPGIRITRNDGQDQSLSSLALPASIAAELFQRSGTVRQITVTFNSDQLLS